MLSSPVRQHIQAQRTMMSVFLYFPPKRHPALKRGQCFEIVQCVNAKAVELNHSVLFFCFLALKSTEDFKIIIPIFAVLFM